jgi:hypothetical protein
MELVEEKQVCLKARRGRSIERCLMELPLLATFMENTIARQIFVGSFLYRVSRFE